MWKCNDGTLGTTVALLVTTEVKHHRCTKIRRNCIITGLHSVFFPDNSVNKAAELQAE